MITNEEINAVKLSATKKDFYQIWNELLDLASKISERWDPQNTNESDPGIVLLKVLTAVADKLNYNVDVNALEAFMPSAAQEESMRKLTEMLGYNMKYFRSATTKAKIIYNQPTVDDGINTEIVFDRFTNLKNIDDTINYVTTKRVSISNSTSGTNAVEVPCIEGELVECETDNDNIISILQLDDNNRYYLPETQIAENGIFVNNITNNYESGDWDKVDNLNTQPLNTHCYKFGFDSKENLPYIQFPEDIADIIEDGLRIKYIRTNGINGNISAKTLYKFEKPESWKAVVEDEDSAENPSACYDEKNYTVTNAAAATNGCNRETLTDAYNNYKKTIGTFDTLVTCRDYMNKIYQLTVSDIDTTPLVSNVIVSDIRDDINKASTLCTFDEHGIEYKNVAKEIKADHTYATKTEFETFKTGLGDGSVESNFNNWKPYLDKVFKIGNEYQVCIFDGNKYDFVTISGKKLDHFDLLFYLFTPIANGVNRLEFDKSFKYDDSNLLEIKNALEENKTLSHNIILPNKNEVACIKNYYQLNVKIITTRKVNTIEQADILTKVYKALYQNFNARKVDFGEALVEDEIKDVIKNADPRIKDIDWNSPKVVTKICTVNGSEFDLTESTNNQESANLAARIYYNKLALNNVLAGRIPLFEYNTNFKPDFNEAKYPNWEEEGASKSYELLYPAAINEAETNGVKKIDTSFKVTSLPTSEDDAITLNANEVIQFRLPNLKTEVTYPAYVNYYLKLRDQNTTNAIPATMQTLRQFFNTNIATAVACAPDTSITVNASNFNQYKAQNILYLKDGYGDPGYLVDAIGNAYTRVSANAIFDSNNTYAIIHKESRGENAISAEELWETAANYSGIVPVEINEPTDEILRDRQNYSAIFKKINNRFEYQGSIPSSIGTGWYYLDITNETWSAWNRCIQEIITSRGHTVPAYVFYKLKRTDLNIPIGYLVTENHSQYISLTAFPLETKPFDAIYVPKTWLSETTEHTEDGLGQDAKATTITADSEYILKAGELLYINYTPATLSEENTNTNRNAINKVYEVGTIIKPNFDLEDSRTYRTAHSYSKTSGFEFSQLGYQNPEGMFSFASNQQVEIRNYVEVDLDENQTAIYWEIQNESNIINDNGRVNFPWDSEPIYKADTGAHRAGEPYDGIPSPSDEGNVWIYSAYTLQEGEYFYYTDKNRTDMAYYGSGTKIKRSVNTPAIFKRKEEPKPAANDIVSLGLAAAIPWHTYSFGDDGTTHKKLTITEYKYITLTEGDKLISVTGQNIGGITSTPQKIISARYKLATDTENTDLQKIDLGNTSWEVLSRLNLDISSNKSQKLYRTSKTESSISIVYNEDQTKTIKAEATDEGGSYIPVAIKSNKIIQTSANTIDLNYVDITDTSEGSKGSYYPVQIKVFRQEELKDSNNDGPNLNNFSGQTFTKLSFNDIREDLSNEHPYEYNLNALIPANHIGLLMVYCNKLKNTDTPKIILTPSDPATQISPKIYNNNDSWWADEESGYLKKNHINIVQIDASCKITFKITSNDQKDAVLIFSNLDIVSSTQADQINKQIKYNSINTSNAMTQILKDIKAIDTENEFYYNAVISNDNAIDLRQKDEALDSWDAWFDYNNINNKFVIGELDSSTFADNITIHKNSKL